VDAARIDVHGDDFHNIVVAVLGEIDLAVHDELLSTIRAAIGRPGVKTVVVDLSRTSFMDAAGIRALLAGREAAGTAGVRYRVVGMAGMVRWVLDVTGVMDALIEPGRPDCAVPVPRTAGGDAAAPTPDVA
jgi:anti-anti-sigma factor